MTSDLKSSLVPDINNLPTHVGIIMDGNGRWAKKKNLPRSFGHQEGLNTVKKIVSCASELGIKYLTIYIFSTENWKRTEQEVGYLMNLIRKHLCDEFNFYKKNNIKIAYTGDLKGLPIDIQEDIKTAEKETESFTGMTIVLAINYGGRNEILRAVKKYVQENNNIDLLTEESFMSSFDIPKLPDLDLLIRTGGEKRLSNFLLWHSAYAELLFTDTLWPDYNKEEFLSNIIEFQKRTRRFGAIPV